MSKSFILIDGRHIYCIIWAVLTTSIGYPTTRLTIFRLSLLFMYGHYKRYFSNPGGEY